MKPSRSAIATVAASGESPRRVLARHSAIYSTAKPYRRLTRGMGRVKECESVPGAC